jgi:hypothetical protein
MHPNYVAALREMDTPRTGLFAPGESAKIRNTQISVQLSLLPCNSERLQGDFMFGVDDLSLDSGGAITPETP